MKYALMLLQLIPALIQAVKSIEEFYPGAGQGKEKIAIIRELMESSYSEIKDAWPAIEKAVAMIVSLANTVGIFKKSA